MTPISHKKKCACPKPTALVARQNPLALSINVSPIYTTIVFSTHAYTQAWHDTCNM
jgi:hypothetical protein